MGHDFSSAAIAELAKRTANIDIVVKGVDLFLKLTVQIPLITFGLAAANMGNGIGKAAVN